MSINQVLYGCSSLYVFIFIEEIIEISKDLDRGMCCRDKEI